LRDELAALDRRETETAKAQVDALMAGRFTAVYDRLLTEIDGKRKQMQARMVALEATEPANTLSYTEAVDKVAEVLLRLDAVLTAEDLMPVEKNGVLSSFIRAIVPEGEGYLTESRLPASACSQLMISTH
jgi:hypothetical protein